MFRKNSGGKYYLRTGRDDRGFEIEEGNSKLYEPFFDYIFKMILSSYKGYIQQFIGERTTRKSEYLQ